MSEIFPPSPISSHGMPSTGKKSEKERIKADRILNQIQNVDWENKDALAYLMKVIDMPGMSVPDVFDESREGCAIWRKRTIGSLQTHAIKVCDECVKIKCLDQQCCTFVYVSIKFDTSGCKCADQMMNVSRHVIIDVEKGIVKARGDSIEM